MKQCINCIKAKECFSTNEVNSYGKFCIDHDMCSFEQDGSKPKYSMQDVRKLLLACATELAYEIDGLSNSEISDVIMDIIKEMDKMWEVVV